MNTKQKKIILRFLIVACIIMLVGDTYLIFKWGTDSFYDLAFPAVIFAALVFLFFKHHKIVLQQTQLSQVPEEIPILSTGRSYPILAVSIVWAVLFWPLLGIVSFVTFGDSGHAYSSLIEIAAFFAMFTLAIAILGGLVLSLINLTDPRSIHIRRSMALLPLIGICIFVLALLTSLL